MAVPNTTTFRLSDVIQAVSGTQNSLLECFSEADSGSFNPSYGSISDSNMLAFRDYDESVGTENSLAITPSSATPSASAGSFNITVTCNTSWSASDNQSWLSVSPSSGSGNGTVTVTYGSNGGSTQRFGTVTIETTSGSPAIDRTCIIEQNGTGGGSA